MSADLTSAAPVRVVIDTNIVLDLWLYKDPATPALLEALERKTVQWFATQVMRDELERVLAYTTSSSVWPSANSTRSTY